MIPFQELVELFNFDISDLPTTVEACAEHLECLRVDKKQQKRIMNVEQRTPEWFASRKNRITASNFAKACGLSRYGSPKTLAKKLVSGYKLKPNVYMQWGIDHEKDASDLIFDVLKKQFPDITLCFPGLIISRKYPFAAVSPDGLFVLNGVIVGLEIKCPKKMYPSIPIEYYIQIQGTMGFLGLKHYFFVVWTPEETKIELFQFNETFFTQTILPSLFRFYFQYFLREYMGPFVIRSEGGLE